MMDDLRRVDSYREVFSQLVIGITASLNKWQAVEKQLKKMEHNLEYLDPRVQDRQLLSLASNVIAAMGSLSSTNLRGLELIDSLESRMGDENLKVLLHQLKRSFLRQDFETLGRIFQDGSTRLQ